MALKAKVTSGGGGDFEKCPAGNNPAVCVAVIGAGTHTQKFGNNPPKDEVKVIIVWEVEAEDKDTEEAKRFYILKDYNLYFNDKSNLRKLVTGWFPTRKFADGEDVDLTKLKGQPCMLNVKESDKGYPYVESAAPLHKSMKAIKPSVEPFAWDIDDGKPYPAAQAGWVPYIWGKPMLDYIKESHELAGKPDRPLTDDGEGTPTEFPHGANVEAQAAEAF